jgi:hypothetical protein
LCARNNGALDRKEAADGSENGNYDEAPPDCSGANIISSRSIEVAHSGAMIRTGGFPSSAVSLAVLNPHDGCYRHARPIAANAYSESIDILSSGCSGSLSDEAVAQSILNKIIVPHIRKILNLSTATSRAIVNGDSDALFTNGDVVEMMRERLPDMILSTMKTLWTHRQLLREFPAMESSQAIDRKYTRVLELVRECRTLLEGHYEIIMTSVPAIDEKRVESDSSHLCGDQPNVDREAFNSNNNNCSHAASDNKREELAVKLLEAVYKKAYEASEIATEISKEPSLMPHQNFPFEQLLAVFAPFWVPILIPLVKGLVMEARMMRQITTLR